MSECLECKRNLTLRSDIINCLKWAFLYPLSAQIPNQYEFQALQNQGFLPTHDCDAESGEVSELYHGHDGYANSYDWLSIAIEIQTMQN